MVEIWDDWRRGCSWGEIQAKDNGGARSWHPSVAGASGTDAAPLVPLRSGTRPGLPWTARLHQRLQLRGGSPQGARRSICGQKGELQQGGAGWTAGFQFVPQQDRHSVSWNINFWTHPCASMWFLLFYSVLLESSVSSEQSAWNCFQAWHCWFKMSSSKTYSFLQSYSFPSKIACLVNRVCLRGLLQNTKTIMKHKKHNRQIRNNIARL